jgi:hypothetical protein
MFNRTNSQRTTLLLRKKIRWCLNVCPSYYRQRSSAWQCVNSTWQHTSTLNKDVQTTQWRRGMWLSLHTGFVWIRLTLLMRAPTALVDKQAHYHHHHYLAWAGLVENSASFDEKPKLCIYIFHANTKYKIKQHARVEVFAAMLGVVE